MDRLTARLNEAERALATLAEALAIEQPNLLERDGALQRFEYTFEVVWKLGQRYIQREEGQQAGSPKAVFRALANAGLLAVADAEHGIEMTDHRNLTVHTYVEGLADEVYGHLPRHLELLTAITSRIATRLATE